MALSTYDRNPSQRNTGIFGYTIPHKDFLVVKRHIKDRSTRGKIIKQFVTKTEADDYLDWLKTCGGPNTEAEFHTWVVAKEDY